MLADWWGAALPLTLGMSASNPTSNSRRLSTWRRRHWNSKLQPGSSGQAAARRRGNTDRFHSRRQHGTARCLDHYEDRDQLGVHGRHGMQASGKGSGADFMPSSSLNFPTNSDVLPVCSIACHVTHLHLFMKCCEQWPRAFRQLLG